MTSKIPYILIFGCFDTKGEVFSYLRDHLMARGERVVSLNTGVLGTTDLFPVDLEADLVAQEAGTTLSVLKVKQDRGHAVDMMGKGAAKIVSFLVSEGGLKAAVGMGGGGGTYIVLSAMQEIPIGIPKICLTTLAAKDLTRQMGDKDIILVPSIVDIAGLNSISKRVIRQTSAAITAMGNLPAPEKDLNKGRIAISMFGNTTLCVNRCTALLQDKGYEVFAFHANGQGGRTMEALIRENYFDAVLDITTTELADDLFGGICSAGPDRMDAASDMATPQVVVPGCLDMVNFGPIDTVPEQYGKRQLYKWAPDVTLMRTNEIENRKLGEKLSDKINRSRGQVKVLLPLNGLSEIDSEGKAFHRPDIDRILFDTIENSINKNIELIKIDAHINEPSFAEQAVDALVGMLEEKLPD